MSIIKHSIAIFLALGLTFLVFVVLDEAEKNTKNNQKNNEVIVSNSLKPVTIINVSPTNAHAVIHSFGEIKARWKTALKAKKQGEILMISKQLQRGNQVKKGELLFTFDNHHYQTQIAEAQNQIAQARLLIQSEKEQRRLVQQDWKILKKKGQPSAFMLKIPQIKAAQSQLNLAKASFNEIKKTGSYSKITAPYNGTVVSHIANLGDVVEAGQVLAEIISSDMLDIILKMNNSQWKMLDRKLQGKIVSVYAVNSAQQWTASIERVGKIVDRKTRQRELYLKISSRHKPLVGSFVRVEITGKEISNLLEIPQSALTTNRKVWFVDSENKLNLFHAEALFSSGKNIFIKAPLENNRKSYLIVVSPLSSFLPGLEVIPKEASLIKKAQ